MATSRDAEVFESAAALSGAEPAEIHGAIHSPDDISDVRSVDSSSLGARISPKITTMIRIDHSHVLALFRRFKPSTSKTRKMAIVANACLALEIHAQLEEEILYSALREAVPGDEVLDKSVPEHDEMRRLIGVLRSLEPESADYDSTFRTLIRTVLHHVADEETVLLPQAELLLQGELRALGARMTIRRAQLLTPHASEALTTTLRSFPLASLALAASAVSVGLGLFLHGRRSHRSALRLRR